jgi:hypothetical protein
MFTSENRITPRFKLQTRLSFHRMDLACGGEHQAKAINMSTRGVYFATDVVLGIGEAVEVLLAMPKRVSGVKADVRRFAGRVAHIESKNMPEGISGVGVELLYYERDLTGVPKSGVL